MKLFLAALIALTGLTAQAGDAPTKEQRAKMAEHHDKMAACLRSDRDMKECHEEMRKACEANEGDQCHMSHGGMGHGAKHGKKMKMMKGKKGGHGHDHGAAATATPAATPAQ